MALNWILLLFQPSTPTILLFHQLPSTPTILALNKFYNLFDLQECLFGCIIFLQSKHIFGDYIRFEGGGRPMKLENAIIAVDFDNTLCFSNWPELGEPNLPLIQYLKQVEKDEIDAIDEIEEKIYRSIKERELAVSYKRSGAGRSKAELNPTRVMLLNFNYTKTPTLYTQKHSHVSINYIHGCLDCPESVIFGYGDELDDGFKKLKDRNNNECLRHMKSIHYLESDNYRKMLKFIESAPFQVCIMGHSCGNSDRTLLNTLFEHRNCVSIKPYYYIKGQEDNYLELVQNISRNFTDMKLMRDRVVNKEYCEPLTIRDNN
jgi:hypothetical protein